MSRLVLSMYWRNLRLSEQELDKEECTRAIGQVIYSWRKKLNKEEPEWPI